MLRIDLRVSATTYAVAGTPIRGQAYDGTFIGPTLRVRPGDTISMRFHNQLTSRRTSTSTAFTRRRQASPTTSCASSRRTTAPVAGAIPQDMGPGTYWYHSHAHGISEAQVFGGLSGVISSRA